MGQRAEGIRYYKEMSEKELKRFQRLYPKTSNRNLRKKFHLSLYAIKKMAKELGLKKRKGVIMKAARANAKALTDAQDAWLAEHYSEMTNRELAEHLGVKTQVVVNASMRLGLKKTPEYRESQLKSMMAHARKFIHDNPLRHERWKRAMEKLRAEGRGYSFPKGTKLRDHYESEEAFRAMLKKRDIKRAETIRKERMRLKWGLPQKTKMRLTVDGMTKEKVMLCAYRWRLRQRDYMVEPASMLVCYDEATRRSERMERNAIAVGFRFEEIKE